MGTATGRPMKISGVKGKKKNGRRCVSQSEMSNISSVHGGDGEKQRKKKTSKSVLLKMEEWHKYSSSSKKYGDSLCCSTGIFLFFKGKSG